MFKVSINISGIADLAGQLNARGVAVEEAKNAAVDKVAQTLQLYAQTNIGGGHPDHPNNMTFTLRNSILWEHVSDGTARVFTNLDYAYWIEFGHTQEPGRYVPAIDARLVQPFVPAYPFFRPAITEVIDGGEAMNIISDIMRPAVENAYSGGGTSSGGMAATEAVASDVAEIMDL